MDDVCLMKKNRSHNRVILLPGLVVLLVLVAALAPAAGTMPGAAAAETMAAPSLVIDSQLVKPSSPLLLEKGTALISLKELSTYLVANCQWNEAEKTAWVQKYGNTIFFRLATGEVLINSQPVAAPVPARLFRDTTYVPLRLVAENLGATVIWDGNAHQIQIVTGIRRTPPERVSSQAFNALVAYTDQGNLWWLDGREPDILPRKLTASGHVELIGWSADGSWLAYKHAFTAGNEPAYLWVIRADGTGARQVDTEPLYGNPSWSPGANRLAYTVQRESAGGYSPAGIVKCAAVTTEKIEIKTLLEEDVIMIPSLAWHPDGESLTVSLPRTGERPPTLEQVTLAGQRKVLYTLKDETAIDPEGLFNWALISLKWSPNGQYLAYHLRMNSGSLTADTVATGVLDTTTWKTVDLNDGLQYPEWLAFSPDNEKLAYIAGTGRDAVLNKRLEIADLSLGRQAVDYSRIGCVDTEPQWLPGEPGGLLFCRGTEAETISYRDIFPGVLVPGQRIYKLDEDGQATALTVGPAATADYHPSPSPSGKEMIFLKLDRFDQGSLYLQPLAAPEKAVEILRGLRGEAGFYGNYYPKWFSVHWL